MEPNYVRHIVEWVLENFFDQQMSTLCWIHETEPTVRNGTLSADSTPTMIRLLEFGLVRRWEDRLVTTTLGKVMAGYLLREFPYIQDDTGAVPYSVEEALATGAVAKIDDSRGRKAMLLFHRAKMRGREEGVSIRWTKKAGEDGVYTLSMTGTETREDAAHWQGLMEAIAVEAVRLKGTTSEEEN